MRKSKKSWSCRIADAIQDAEVFDLTADENGFPTIYWLIAQYLCAGFTEFGRLQLMATYTKKIQNSFTLGVAVLESRGVHCYRHRPSGKIRCVTTRGDYQVEPGLTAKTADFTRIRDNVMQDVKRTLIQVNAKHPRRLQTFVKTMNPQLLLPLNSE